MSNIFSKCKNCFEYFLPDTIFLSKLDVRAPNSPIVAVLTAIPTMKTAQTHFQYRYLEEQGDSE